MVATEPFHPEGVVWTSVSPRLASARRVVSTTTFLLLAAAFAVPAIVLEQLWMAVVPVLFVALAVWVWIVIGRQVRAWGYAEREDDLLIRSGVAWRRIVVVPYGRMQYVDVQAGPMDRSFKIATLQLHTASASSDASIPGLPPEEAARLRDRLASRGHAQLAGL